MNLEPKLRFSEFDGEWKIQKLREFATTYSGGTPTSSNKSYYKGDIPFIKSGEIAANVTSQCVNQEALNNSSAKRVHKGDILYALYGATSGQVAISKLEGAINQAVLCIRTGINTYFLYSSLINSKNKILKTYLQGGQGNLSAEIIKELQFAIPNEKEQDKIADFMLDLDEKIAKLDEYVELLKKYKKCITQQIFEKKIDFKNKKGGSFPQWKEMELSGIGTTYSGLVGKTGADFGSGFRYITYKQIFDQSKVDIARSAFVRIGDSEKQNKVQTGDIFFTISSETPDEVGLSSVLMDNVADTYLNSFCFGFRPDQRILYSAFAQYLFRSRQFRINAIRLAQGSTRYNISKAALMKTFVMIPSIEEQQVIADFLNEIDLKIVSYETILMKTCILKKTLLRQMLI